MTAGTYDAAAPGLAAPRRAGIVERLPLLFDSTPLDRATALGALFDSDWRDTSVEACRERLGAFAPALDLLPRRERRRAALLACWTDALLETAEEPDDAGARLVRLHRSAFQLAKALAGEASRSPFAARLAAESRARELPRRALDALLREARVALEAPAAAGGDRSAQRARQGRAIGGAFAEALFGLEPSAASVDTMGALFRLSRIGRLAGDGAAVANSAPTELTAELIDVREQLLRGARALAEVPLGYRRSIAFLSTAGLDLLGRIEERPEALRSKPPRAGFFRRQLLVWRARRTPLD